MVTTASSPVVNDPAPALDPTTAAAPATVPAESQTSGDIPASPEDFDNFLEGYLNSTDPPPAPAAPPEAAPAPVEPAPAKTDDDDEDDSAAPLAKNFREVARDDFEAEVFRLRKRNRDMTLHEAIARVEAKRAPKTAPAAAPETPAPPVPVSVTPDTNSVASLEARRAELKAAIKKAAAEDFDFEKVAELQMEMAELPFQIQEARERERSEQHAQQTAAQSAIAAAEAKAVELYPDINVEGSEIRGEMESIRAALEDAGDPLLDQPDCGLQVARMAARNLAIAPATAKRKTTSPPEKVETPEPATAPNPVRPRPMTGSGASPQTVPPLDLKKLSLDELDALARSL